MAFSVLELPEIKHSMVSWGRHVGEGSMNPRRQFDLVWEPLWSIPSRVPSTRQQTHAVAMFLGKQHFARCHGMASLLFSSLRATLSSSFSTFFLHFMFPYCLKSANDQKTEKFKPKFKA